MTRWKTQEVVYAWQYPQGRVLPQAKCNPPSCWRNQLPFSRTILQYTCMYSTLFTSFVSNQCIVPIYGYAKTLHMNGIKAQLSGFIFNSSCNSRSNNNGKRVIIIMTIKMIMYIFGMMLFLRWDKHLPESVIFHRCKHFSTWRSGDPRRPPSEACDEATGKTFVTEWFWSVSDLMFRSRHSVAIQLSMRVLNQNENFAEVETV